MVNSLHPERQQQLQRCLQKLGVPETLAVNWELLDQALTHSSKSAEYNYEYLEFLGDAVLRLTAAACLLEFYPDLSVGEMAALRSQLVSDATLAELADGLGLERYLLLSRAALRDQTGRLSWLAESFEAVLGALYQSQPDIQAQRQWLDRHLLRLITKIRQDPTLQNYKAALQELTQGYNKQLPIYRTIEVSQVHGDLERYSSEVWFLDRRWGEGRGRSIKQAEQAAARVAFEALQQYFSELPNLVS